jgi:hypothetical protein
MTVHVFYASDGSAYLTVRSPQVTTIAAGTSPARLPHGGRQPAGTLGRHRSFSHEFETAQGQRPERGPERDLVRWDVAQHCSSRTMIGSW